MSKIICDVCGTSYPETATQCPICGCVRPADAVTLMTEPQAQTDAFVNAYTYVKGGRFSKANVRKRLVGTQGAGAQEASAAIEAETPQQERGNTGLIVAVIVLLLAVVAVGSYFAVRFLLPDSSELPPISDMSGTTSATDTAALEFPCQELKLSSTVIDMETLNMAQLLNVTTVPANTTDTLVFSSSDEAVATVTSGGKITAAGPGQAVITVTCGSVTAQCRVVCKFETVPSTEETSEATEASTEATTPAAPESEFSLNREDFTMSAKGNTWTLYNGTIPKSDIKWTTDNPLVATIDNGIVTAVGGGTTKVHGEYNGVKKSCIVRCSFAPAETQPGETTEEQPSGSKSYTISHTDVTIRVGESFTLTLKDETGAVMDVTWNPGSYSNYYSISGNSITGAKILSYGVVSTVYDGNTYSCIVRVKAA